MRPCVVGPSIYLEQFLEWCSKDIFAFIFSLILDSTQMLGNGICGMFDLVGTALCRLGLLTPTSLQAQNDKALLACATHVGRELAGLGLCLSTMCATSHGLIYFTATHCATSIIIDATQCTSSAQLPQGSHIFGPIPSVGIGSSTYEIETLPWILWMVVAPWTTKMFFFHFYTWEAILAPF